MTSHDDVSKLFRGRYRILSARKPGWDYGQLGWYYVTICTERRISWFGEVRNGQMLLSSIGQIVVDEWQRTEQVRRNVQLDAWIVMPDHMHGIIRIISDGTNWGGSAGGVWDGSAGGVRDGSAGGVETFRRNVSTAGASSLHRPPSGTIGSIINQFKSVCTKRIRAIESDFAWQPRFHDHVIRDAGALRAIRRYILHNPAVWWERNGRRFGIGDGSKRCSAGTSPRVPL